ncbi:L,D-transpeptidase family protein [Streptomyces sp. TG1A-8]|uniref:L,D-transpeptidase family protein n=1 Tax=Streptomyces sp. TG1A-8 TaxID=3051385 RepID=UPI00265C0087|nr:L,D-transpeptidase family protein [Streptomyces sp. TG1A-8]MDO0928934.1 L,D-transpeptidase family protein [Streptomyces sp. TG1A-8]
MALGTLLSTLSGCGGPAHPGSASGPRGRIAGSPSAPAVPAPEPTRVPGIGDRVHRRIPAGSSQVVAVYGEGRDSADSTVVLYTRRGAEWRPAGSWPAHNGRKGWTSDHRMGDERSPIGVFTLSAAGGVLADPGARLPYDQDENAYAPPDAWDRAHQHDFDYVIAIDYNRLPGTPPHDGTLPLGEEKGGGIWLHLDHGGGTSACVSVSREAMRYLLRTLDPARHPVIVMGDRRTLHA